MKAASLLLSLVLAGEGRAQPAGETLELRFAGPSARNDLCTYLLDARAIAAQHGRLDFAVEVEAANAEASPAFVARVRNGSAVAVHRIQFVGNSNVDDATLRRAMLVKERDHLNVNDLHRSLRRINEIGVFEPIGPADVGVVMLDDGVSADLTIPLRARKPRWWSVSPTMFPMMRLEAALSSRLPPWGSGFLQAATYFVSLTLVGFDGPIFALSRPILPGQEWLSGFAISPNRSPRSMLLHYGRTHAARAIDTLLDAGGPEPLVVPVKSSNQSDSAPLICKPPQGRLWWVRRGGSALARVALAGTL
jgi:hypothetical protein